ncbi:hypothetical protein Lal_00042459 [Lupinus albus]|nr:hypothetical protein Lal_00042459 [Lupinus albus]
MRVLPLDNEAINECWLSDKDRFAYEGVNSDDRLTQPMLKQGGQWKAVDWTTALEYVANGLNEIKRDHGAEQIATTSIPSASVRFLGQADGRSVARHAHRRRVAAAAYAGRRLFPAQGSPTAGRASASGRQEGCATEHDRRRWRGSADACHATVGRTVAMAVAAVASGGGVAAANNVARPGGTDGIEAGDIAQRIAASLASGERKAVFLGNAAVAHPQFSQLHALAQQRLGRRRHVGATASRLRAVGRRTGIRYCQPHASACRAGPGDTVIVLAPFASRAALEYATCCCRRLRSPKPRARSSTARDCHKASMAFVRGLVRKWCATKCWPSRSSSVCRTRRLRRPPPLLLLAAGIERLADVPIYHADPIVRRAGSLQLTAAARAAVRAGLPADLYAQLGLANGDAVRVTQGQRSVVLRPCWTSRWLLALNRPRWRLRCKGQHDRVDYFFRYRHLRWVVAAGLDAGPCGLHHPAAAAVRGLPDPVGAQAHRLDARASGPEPRGPDGPAAADCRRAQAAAQGSHGAERGQPRHVHHRAADGADAAVAIWAVIPFQAEAMVSNINAGCCTSWRSARWAYTA